MEQIKALLDFLFVVITLKLGVLVVIDRICNLVTHYGSCGVICVVTRCMVWPWDESLMDAGVLKGTSNNPFFGSV